MKDNLPIEKQSKIVYQIFSSCGKAYINETRTGLETSLKEHQDECQKEHYIYREKSVIEEQAWETHHSIKWEETSAIDQARHLKEFLLKEAGHI